MHSVDTRNGTLVHHLKMLERHKMVYHKRDGVYKRYYPKKVVTLDKAYLSDIQERILEALRDDPGVTQVEVADVLGKPKQVVHYHLRQLSRAGLVRRVKVGRNYRCYPKGKA